ncbi:MAG: hypothetical protein LBU15_00800 [Rickettsiales bacterium]|jgi:hypothetical protein|nr:hypothetical protein [Rickettsiales bacterium]
MAHYGGFYYLAVNLVEYSVYMLVLLFVSGFAVAMILTITLNFYIHRFKDKKLNLLSFYGCMFMSCLYIIAGPGSLYELVPKGACMAEDIIPNQFFVILHASVVLDLLATAFYFRDRKKIAIPCLLLEAVPILLIMQFFHCDSPDTTYSGALQTLAILMGYATLYTALLVLCVKCLSTFGYIIYLTYRAIKKFWADRRNGKGQIQ